MFAKHKGGRASVRIACKNKEASKRKSHGTYLIRHSCWQQVLSFALAVCIRTREISGFSTGKFSHPRPCVPKEVNLCTHASEILNPAPWLVCCTVMSRNVTLLILCGFGLGPPAFQFNGGIPRDPSTMTTPPLVPHSQCTRSTKTLDVVPSAPASAGPWCIALVGTQSSPL